MEYIYVSTHLDDVTLSCGGQIARSVREGATVTSVTVMAGVPDLSGPLSDLIREFHGMWGNADEITRLRREEDRRACAALGARCVQLEFLDCIYRKDEKTGEYYILTWQDTSGQIKKQDESLPAKIADRLQELYPETEKTGLYFPLAAGVHVDHIVVHRAGILMRERGYRVGLYEDYPYAEYDGATERACRALHDAASWESRVVNLAEEDIAKKINAITCYESQIPMLFKQPEKLESRVRKFIEKTGGERIWEYIER